MESKYPEIHRFYPSLSEYGQYVWLMRLLQHPLVVEQIKENKIRRQLIIVTHNPNIPVNGDSELIVVMETMPSGDFTVGSMGGLQETQTRKNICDIMEGGETAFKKRYERIIGIE